MKNMIPGFGGMKVRSFMIKQDDLGKFKVI